MPVTEQLTPTSQLDAVNVCLTAIGEMPVSTLTNSDLASVALSLQFLTECSRSLQAMGWDFNSDDDYTLVRNADTTITIPLNALQVDTTRAFNAYDVVWRAGKLYDRAKHQFTFDKDLHVNILWMFPYEDLPQSARWYIAVASARKLQERMLGSTDRGRFTQEDESRAWASFKDADGKTGDYNMFTDSVSVSQLLDRSPDTGTFLRII